MYKSINIYIYVNLCRFVHHFVVVRLGDKGVAQNRARACAHCFQQRGRAVIVGQVARHCVLTCGVCLDIIVCIYVIYIHMYG